MSEDKSFSVSIYYSGSYHIDVEAIDRDNSKQIAIELLRDDVGYGFSVESVDVFEIGE